MIIKNILEGFVLEQLFNHTVRYNLKFWEKSSEIIKYVKEGVYAFQIIYNENSEVILIKPLDCTKVIQIDIHCAQNLWSYDGGKQFKYTSKETLKLDIQKIRELKLSQLL